MVSRRRRVWLKLLHWSSFALLLCYFFFEPPGRGADPGAALSTHSGVGLIPAVFALIWIALYLRGGRFGRPDPSLSVPMQQFHRFSHLGHHCHLKVYALRIMIPQKLHRFS